MQKNSARPHARQSENRLKRFVQRRRERKSDAPHGKGGPNIERIVAYRQVAAYMQPGNQTESRCHARKKASNREKERWHVTAHLNCEEQRARNQRSEEHDGHNPLVQGAVAFTFPQKMLDRIGNWQPDDDEAMHGACRIRSIDLNGNRGHPKARDQKPRK